MTETSKISEHTAPRYKFLIVNEAGREIVALYTMCQAVREARKHRGWEVWNSKGKRVFPKNSS